MKNIILVLAAALILASCSAPKYAYRFDNHDYYAGKRKQTPAVTGVSTAAPAPSTVDVVLASAGSDLNLIDTKPVSITEKKGARASFTKQQRKEVRKQLMSVIKTYKKDAKSASPDATAGGDKNQFVAAILAFFLGWIGIHRFYIGRTGTALLQVLLFVVGLFTVIPLYVLGVWVLIDLILIILGKLTPKNGSYNPSF